MPTLTRSVFVLLFLLVLSLAAVNARAQCPAFTFSAAAGPSHRQITLTIGGQINGTAQVQLKDNNGVWHTQFSTISTGTFVMGTYGHNHTLEFRATNGGSCFGWIEASATTFDVGQPWLDVWPGPGNSVYVQSGAVDPDLNSGVRRSSDGVNFVLDSVWQTLPQNGLDPPKLIPITSNQTYYFDAFIDIGNGVRRQTPVIMVRLSPDQDYGSCSRVQISEAPKMIGRPVNVINGNMYLSQTDYKLPGIGRTIDVTRSYNSMLQVSGMFGLGWTTEYDQYLTLIDSKNIRLQMPDGRGVYFARPTASGSFTGITQGFPGDLVNNGDGTFTLTLKDGSTSKFNATGKLLWQKDRNGNQTTLNYNTNGVLTGVTDASGRTLTITIGSNGFVSQISDTLGVIANYEYDAITPNLLKSVTYTDESKYQFEYDTTSAPGKTLLKTVKDALNKVIETHAYDIDGRATTSEGETIQGVVQEKYTLNYANSGFTTVTDGLGRETKYYFDRTNSRNVVKKIEGSCNCGGGGSETAEFFYDADLNLTKKIDALGRLTTYTYDDESNVITQTDLFGTQTWTYNS